MHLNYIFLISGITNWATHRSKIAHLSCCVYVFLFDNMPGLVVPAPPRPQSRRRVAVP